MLHFFLINSVSHSALDCVLGSALGCVVLSFRSAGLSGKPNIALPNKSLNAASAGQPTAWAVHQLGVIRFKRVQPLSELISNTPIWVFAIFCILLVLGFIQSKERTVRVKTIFILPIAMITFSFFGFFCFWGFYISYEPMDYRLSYNLDHWFKTGLSQVRQLLCAK